ncbi:MAG: ATP-binding cassette domain-containing protein [Epsilonproteobacteria bacterium]|nr:ATP-binding cassette domain-containing protein [Campylobacterota bacterium]
MSILKIENLTFGYKEGALLYKDFSLSLEKGEVVSIVGASGSGKSTLFDLITGVLNPHFGSIEKSKIAQIYQDPYSSFHPSYALISQIQEVASLEGIEGYLKKLNLESALLEKKPHQLSGGQLQRCSILRALLMKADLILADEPTSALDNVVQLDVMKLLMQFLDRVGIVLITHDDDLATWASDRIVRL